MAGQVAFYAAGMLGRSMAERHVKHKAFFVPYYFLFMNVNVVKGAWYLKQKGRNDGTWEKAKRA
jgi:hypothetical protein